MIGRDEEAFAGGGNACDAVFVDSLESGEKADAKLRSEAGEEGGGVRADINSSAEEEAVVGEEAGGCVVEGIRIKSLDFRLKDDSLVKQAVAGPATDLNSGMRSDDGSEVVADGKNVSRRRVLTEVEVVVGILGVDLAGPKVSALGLRRVRRPFQVMKGGEDSGFCRVCPATRRSPLLAMRMALKWVS